MGKQAKPTVNEVMSFLLDVAKDIETLRENLRDAIELARDGCVPIDAVLEKWDESLKNTSGPYSLGE